MNLVNLSEQHLTPFFLFSVPDSKRGRRRERERKGANKEHTRQVIHDLGGDAAHYGGEYHPRSNTAADFIDGSRAMRRELSPSLHTPIDCQD